MALAKAAVSSARPSPAAPWSLIEQRRSGNTGMAAVTSWMIALAAGHGVTGAAAPSAGAVAVSVTAAGCVGPGWGSAAGPESPGWWLAAPSPAAGGGLAPRLSA